MPSRRIQLTLFVPEPGPIEFIRRKYNPEQYALIATHTTLCREDELINRQQVLHNLEQLNFPSITLQFGKPFRFNNGKGVMLPALEGNTFFRELRKAVLQGIIDEPRDHEPHITLMHPRNSECTDEAFEEITRTSLPGKILFNKISLIEQVDGGQWTVIKEIKLRR